MRRTSRADRDAPRDGRPAPPYSALAAGYDLVMAHVDYAQWAAYAYRLLGRHQPDVHSVLELACGTGSFALALQTLGPYRYRATDRSPEMIAVARRKAQAADVHVDFAVEDFTRFRTDRRYDVAILLYDSVNYLLDEADVEALLRCTRAALKPGGVFLFDQSTPTNSINNEAYFEDRGGQDGFHYVRRSWYDRASMLHTTRLDLEVGGRRFQEEHVQRAYTLAAMRRLLAETGFAEEAAYDGLGTAPASEASERVHWIARRVD